MRALLTALAFIALAAPASAGEPKPFVTGSYAEIRAERAGRPFVVAFWSLRCAPCLHEMPMWRALIEQAGVDVVFVATDRAEDAAGVAGTLAKHGLGAVESWLFAERFVERLRFQVDPKWRGELPRAYLISADGAARAVTGHFDPALVRDWLAAQVRP